MAGVKPGPAGKYKLVECQRGREWIFRVGTGDDVWHAVQQFAYDYDIKYAKVHASVMGGLKPAKYMVWAYDPRDPTNWHYEAEATLQNLSMVLSLNGMIILRKMPDGRMEPRPAIHFVAGGGWDVPTVGGHLWAGTIAMGSVTFFITEILGIEDGML